MLKKSTEMFSSFSENKDNSIMKENIIAKNKEHLKDLINKEIQKHGNECDLNFIGVSQITDMSKLFYQSAFNGDISGWDVSNVENMDEMFRESLFNGNISSWDVSQVKEMSFLFFGSAFNGNISKWNTSKVECMNEMFACSNFNGDISHWDVSNVEDMRYMFYNCNATAPYWAKIENEQDRKNAIEAYHTQKQLQLSINNSNNGGAIIKI